MPDAREVRAPDCEGWWLRGKGGFNVKLFFVQGFDDGTPLSIWDEDIEDFIPVTKYVKPLVRWWGPIVHTLSDEKLSST